MKELENFYNDGFGWICRRCEIELKTPSKPAKHSRLMREGEHEKNLRLSTPALASWADKSRTTLRCPRCGVTESAGEK